MTAALIGLLGVVVGAGITTGAAFWRERVRSRRAQRRAARVLFDQIQLLSADLDCAIRPDPVLAELNAVPVPEENPARLVEMWRDMAGDLVLFSTEDWNTVRLAVHVTSRFWSTWVEDYWQERDRAGAAFATASGDDIARMARAEEALYGSTMENVREAGPDCLGRLLAAAEVLGKLV